jgi:predicted nuclease of restriction endonuclease-like (RecB) superfamily
MRFNQLIDIISETHSTLQQKATSAVNQSLTVRNWLIGFYIVEFEQNGEDRAKYGDRLLENIAESTINIRGLSFRNLKLCRQFYTKYLQIGQTVSAQLQMSDFDKLRAVFKQSALPIPHIGQTLSAQLQVISNSESIGVNSRELVSRLSFSQFVELIGIDDPLKRAFYEIECIKGNWSVRELKRQIKSLYFERSGLSRDKTKLSAYTQKKAAPLQPEDVIRDPFFFEFLGLKDSDIVRESDLEQALLDNLQAFMLELGHGFCFEARQKRITIGSEYFFVDLVFYHRILKCHILIELKVEEFKHVNLAQLNTYLNYYKKNEKQEDDNPPVGILLCTDKNHALVEYATAGIDNNLFVSKYQLILPTKEELRKFIENEIARRGF